ncbi:hypothetical protein ATKI12_2900 [Kitasatospora sp. Ki12]|uniref:hypothetical protein n=1 Tax=Kitasatospora xanthocidica TaxID=83382 RepID=UPI001676B54B|nr:hypothetical protein [Kitasatospora xanthocidica]
MRANHATKPRAPAPHGITGARRGPTRWLRRPRALAAGWALLAQLWGLGAAGAYAASAEPLPDPAQPAVRRALHGAPALDGPALDGSSTGRPAGPGQSATDPAGRSPGLVGELTGDGPAEGATGAVRDTLQDRIRAGGLPLPGQRAALPDAFAIASGLLDTVPAQARPAETRASREGEPTGPPAGRPRPGTDRAAVPRQREVAEAATEPQAAAATVTTPGAAADRDGTAPTTAPAGPGDAGTPGTPETLAIADTATVTAVDDGSATATAVLAPIAAGLLLTGAAMCKHRGLPRGH